MGSERCIFPYASGGTTPGLSGLSHAVDGKLQILRTAREREILSTSYLFSGASFTPLSAIQAYHYIKFLYSRLPSTTAYTTTVLLLLSTL